MSREPKVSLAIKVFDITDESNKIQIHKNENERWEGCSLVLISDPLLLRFWLHCTWTTCFFWFLLLSSSSWSQCSSLSWSRSSKEEKESRSSSKRSRWKQKFSRNVWNFLFCIFRTNDKNMRISSSFTWNLIPNSTHKFKLQPQLQTLT